MKLTPVEQYISYGLCFLIGQGLNVWGLFSTLKLPNISTLEAFMRAMPWGWAAWFFTSIAVMLGDKYKLVTPTQDTFLLIITQFSVLMGIDRFYLKQGVSRSDVVAFLLILVAIAVLGTIPSPP